MKEVTYKDWLKNPIPRMMWIWDNKEEDKIKRKVIYFVENKDVSYPVVVLSSAGDIAASYKHCAEIEEPRWMTYNVIFIREHYKPRDKQYSALKLGKMFGVTEYAIKDVIRGKSWRWL